MKRSFIKKIFLSVLIPAVILCVFTGGTAYAVSDSTGIADEHIKDSVESEDRSASLEPDNGSYSKYTGDDNIQKYYPRIKKIKDTYILFFQGKSLPDESGRQWTHVWYAVSKDLVEWSEPEIVWAPVYNTDPDAAKKNDVTVFTNADAIVWEDGRVFVYASYHSHRYNDDSDAYGMNGLIVKEGWLSDNGVIGWNDEEDYQIQPTLNGGSLNIGRKILYSYNTPWEPFAFEDGKDLVMLYSEGVNFSRLNGFTHTPSSASVVVSHDRGKTWTESKILTHRYIGTYEGEILSGKNKGSVKNLNYYSGQMPVAAKLKNGNYFFAYEIWRPVEGSLGYTVETSVYSSDYDFDTATGIKSSDVRFHSVSDDLLSDDPRGGKDYDGDVEGLEVLIDEGAAPYILQFPSGEVIVSFNNEGIMYASLLSKDSDGKGYHADTVRLLEYGAWGSVFPLDDHSFIAAFTSEGAKSIVFKKVYLNHSFEAGDTTPVLDGRSDEWTEDNFLFLGSDSKARTFIKCSHNNEYIYFLIRNTYENDTENVMTELILNDDADRDHEISVSEEGVVCNDLDIECVSNSSIELGDDLSQTAVLTTEIKISKSQLDSESLRLYAGMTVESGDYVITDVFQNTDLYDKESWPEIRFTKKEIAGVIMPAQPRNDIYNALTLRPGIAQGMGTRPASADKGNIAPVVALCIALPAVAGVVTAAVVVHKMKKRKDDI